MNRAVTPGLTTPNDAVIHIVCPCYDGARWLPDFVDSLRAQTHRAWHLHCKDDGSRDATRSVLADLAATEPARVTCYPAAPTGQGAAQSFGWLLQTVSAGAHYVACADQDDVWLPHKLERSLAQLQQAEATYGRECPLLLHSDLEVVDDELRPIAPSFARYSGRHLGHRRLRETVVGNVVTGCTMLMNRALLQRALPLPAQAAMHDWWLACVAAAVGHTVVLDEPLLRYRQHAHNAVGAQPRLGLSGRRAALAQAWQGLRRGDRVRRDIAAAAAQADALLARLGHDLRPEDRDFARDYAALPTLPWAARKRALLRLHWLPERGWLRNLGLVLRG